MLLMYKRIITFIAFPVTPLPHIYPHYLPTLYTHSMSTHYMSTHSIYLPYLYVPCMMYPLCSQIIEMFIIILVEQSHQANNRFKQKSREIIDVLLPQLAQQKVAHTHAHARMYTHTCTHVHTVYRAKPPAYCILLIRVLPNMLKIISDIKIIVYIQHMI